MKNLIKEKLRSPKGASLTFALLLFLVCTVIGAVVLVAGTASTGRVSQLAEMDQRYYSVMSAAQLMAQELSAADEISIIRERSHSTRTVDRYTIIAYEVPDQSEEDGEEDPDTFTIETAIDGPVAQPKEFRTKYETHITGLVDAIDPNPLYAPGPGEDDPWSIAADSTDAAAAAAEAASYSSEGSEINLDGVDFLTRQAVFLMFGKQADNVTPNNCNNEDTMDLEHCSFSSGKPSIGDFSITLTVPADSGVNADKLRISGQYKVREDGSITLLVKSDDESYKVMLNMTPVIDEYEEESTKTEQETTDPEPDTSIYTYNGYEVYSASSYDVKKTVTETRKTTSKIRWTLDEIVKVYGEADLNDMD